MLKVENVSISMQRTISWRAFKFEGERSSDLPDFEISMKTVFKFKYLKLDITHT